MAITYTLSVDCKKVEIVYTIIEKIGIKYKKAIIKKKLAHEKYSYQLHLSEEKGLTIFFAENPKKIIYKESEFISLYSITFRFDKLGKFSDIVYNMLTITATLIAYNKFDNYIFTFEGETVILSKINTNQIYLNNKDGFWDDGKLKDIFKEFSIEIVDDTNEVDYYRIEG